MDSNDLALWVGVLAGVIGVAAGIFAIIWGLGFVEYLGGKKKTSIPSVPGDTLKERLLRLNSPELPYELKPFPEADPLVEWNSPDAKWLGVFSQEHLRKTYKGYMLIDQSRKSVRYCEEILTVRWLAGPNGLSPTVSYDRQFFRGRVLFQKSWEVGYGMKEDRSFGKVYEYKFDIRTVRNPIIKTVQDSGWEFVPVVRKAHATRQPAKK